MMKDKIQSHWNDALARFPQDRIIGVFCQGSQNYNLSDEKSDLDTKCLVVPSIQDFITGKEMGRGNFTHIRPDQEHIVFTDVRGYFGHLKDGSPNFVELLFSKEFIINPRYEDLWNRLLEKREEIARYNPKMAAKSMNRMIQNKYDNLVNYKTYPTRMYILKDYNYDPKELSHLIRVFYLLEDYINDKAFADCLLGEESKRAQIKQIKRQSPYSYDEAIALGKEYADKANEIWREFSNNTIWKGNEPLKEYMDDTLKEIVYRSIRNEIN